MRCRLEIMQPRDLGFHPMPCTVLSLTVSSDAIIVFELRRCLPV
jgi:hypothetical protein